MNNNEKFEQIIKDVNQISDLKASDIPSLDLYMDQILTLFDVNLADNKRHPEDKLLTKTMINNYSKEGLLKPIKGKKYSKDHILQMILIYSLKNTISIQEIKQVLQPYHEQTDKVEPIYNSFLEQKKVMTEHVSKEMDDYIKDHHINLDNEDEITMTILLLCSISNHFKTIAERLLDTYYTQEEK